MARARAEQDGDVARFHLAGEAGLLVANGLLAQHARNLVGDRVRADHRIVGERQTQRRPVRIPHRIDGETVRFVVLEIVSPPGAAAHLGKQLVDEREQFRHGAKTPRDRSSSTRSRTQPVDEAAGFLENGDLRVAEPIDRLLAIADDEDGGVRRESEPLAPRLDQQ